MSEKTEILERFSVRVLGEYIMEIAVHSLPPPLPEGRGMEINSRRLAAESLTQDWGGHRGALYTLVHALGTRN